MEETEGRIASCVETNINDLPTECLTEIFLRVGNGTFPTKRDVRRHLLASSILQCSLVCRQWCTIVSTVVRSLTLDVHRLNKRREEGQLSNVEVERLARRFCNVTKLTLTRSWGLRPFAEPYEDVLDGLETFAPSLRTLSIMFPVTSVTAMSFVQILHAGQNIRRLTATFHLLHVVTVQKILNRITPPQEDLPSIAEEQECLDALCALPLTTLTLSYYGSGRGFHAACLALDNMRTLQRWHLNSYRIPPASACHLGGILRTLDWAQGREGQAHALGSLTALEELTIRHSDLIATLPDCLGNLSRLKRLKLRDLGRLVTLPRSIGWLRSLESLSIVHCHSFRALPETVRGLPRLTTLEVNEDCEIQTGACTYW